MNAKQTIHLDAINKNLKLGNVKCAVGLALDFTKTYPKAAKRQRTWFAKIDAAAKALSDAIKS